MSPSKYCNQSNRCHSQKPLFVMKWILNFSQVRRFHYSQCMKIPSIFLQQQLCPVTKIKNFCLSTWSTVNWQVRKQIIHICNMRNIKEREGPSGSSTHLKHVNLLWRNNQVSSIKKLQKLHVVIANCVPKASSSII